MEQEKTSGKPKIALILIGLGILCMFVAAGFYLLKDDKKEPATTNNESLTTYHIVDGEEYTIYEVNDSNKLVESTEKLSFDYPLLDIDSTDAKKVNEDIKKKYDDAYNDMFSVEAKGCVAVKKDNKTYGSAHVVYYKYDVFENDKMIAIALTQVVSTRCASGGEYYFGYAIDKTTNKIMTNTELTSYFNVNNETVINGYNEQAKNVNGDPAATIEDVMLIVKEGKLYYVEYYGDGSGLVDTNK